MSKYYSRIGAGIIIALLFILYAILFSPNAHGAETGDATLVAQAVEQAKEVAAPVLPSLKETANNLLVGLIQTATQAGDFIKEQIPKVIKELLLYNTAIEAFQVLLSSVILALLWGKWFQYWHKKAVKERDADYYFTALFPSGILSLFLCPWLYFSLTNLLKITLAPRVWLIEYAADLVK
jgi:hypothetical protein